MEKEESIFFKRPEASLESLVNKNRGEGDATLLSRNVQSSPPEVGWKKDREHDDLIQPRIGRIRLEYCQFHREAARLEMERFDKSLREFIKTHVAEVGMMELMKKVS